MPQLPLPFKDFEEAHKNNADGVGGFYPVGKNGFYHGGIHFYSTEPVRAIADGHIVAYRLNRKYIPIKKGDTTFDLSNSFILLRHEYETPNKQKIEYYSLYMHLMPWNSYDKSKDKYPEFVYTSVWEIDTTEDGTGQNIRSETDYNTIVGVIPREAVFKKLSEAPPSWTPPEGKPADLYRNHRKVSWDGKTGYTWLSDTVASRVTDTLYQLNKKPTDPPLEGTAGLNIRNGGAGCPVIAVFSKGTKVYFQNEDELRAGTTAYCQLSAEKHGVEKAGHVYVKGTLKENRTPVEPVLDTIVNPEIPMPVKQGDILGYPGKYYDDNVLHFEIFTPDIGFMRNPKKDKSSRPYYLLKEGVQFKKKTYSQPKDGLNIDKNNICVLITKQSDCGKGWTVKSRHISVAETADLWVKRSAIAPATGTYYSEEDKAYLVAYPISTGYKTVSEAGQPDVSSKVTIDIQKDEYIQWLGQKRGEYRLVRAKLKGQRTAYWVIRDDIKGKFKGNEYWLSEDIASVYTFNPEIPRFEENLPEQNQADSVYEPSEVEKIELFGEKYYGFKIDGKDERGWASERNGVQVLDPFNWEQFFEVLKDATQNGYCDVKALIKKIEEVKGNKQDNLLDTEEIKRAINDPVTAKYLRRLVINESTEWSQITDQKTRKYHRYLGDPWYLHFSWVKKWIFESFKDFQFWDDVKPKGLNPASLYFFHPVAFIEHLGRLEVPYIFPLPFRSEKTYHTGPRVYEYLRLNDFTGKKDRQHAGCDLYGSVGTPIFAIADGIVQEVCATFYLSTNRLVINHGKYTVLYGEIDPESVPEHLNSVGAKVKRGETIATIGALTKKDGTRLKNNEGELLEMLHFELYSNALPGNILKNEYPKYHPKFRRADNINPTEFLDNSILT